MLLVTSAVKIVLSISQNGSSPITLNKQLGHLNKDIINASISLSSFSFMDASKNQDVVVSPLSAHARLFLEHCDEEKKFYNI
jgi:hypothetical protein